MLRKNCRGLVQNKNLRLARKRLRYFDSLAVADRKGSDARPHIEVAGIERLKDGCRLARGGGPIEYQSGKLSRHVAGKDVLGDGQFRIKTELLVNRGDSMGLRLTWMRKMDRLAMHLHFTGRRRIYSGHDFDQGRLARAVFS